MASNFWVDQTMVCFNGHLKQRLRNSHQYGVLGLEESHENVVGLDDGVAVVEGQGQDGLIRFPFGKRNGEFVVQRFWIFEAEFEDLVLWLHVAGVALEAVEL